MASVQLGRSQLSCMQASAHVYTRTPVGPALAKNCMNEATYCDFNHCILLYCTIEPLCHRCRVDSQVCKQTNKFKRDLAAAAIYSHSCLQHTSGGDFELQILGIQQDCAGSSCMHLCHGLTQVMLIETSRSWQVTGGKRID